MRPYEPFDMRSNLNQWPSLRSSKPSSKLPKTDSVLQRIHACVTSVLNSVRVGAGGSGWPSLLVDEQVGAGDGDGEGVADVGSSVGLPASAGSATERAAGDDVADADGDSDDA